MSASGGSGSYGARPSRPSRIDLGYNDDDDVELDYSEHPGPSNPSHRAAPLHHLPSSSRLDNHHHRRSPSPQPDADVLAYIRAQRHNDHLSTSAHQLELAEQLKKEKFQHGAGKTKSRVQKEREAEERKKKQAEQDAKTAYDEFVAAMGGDQDEREAGGEQRKRKAVGFVGAGGKKYVGSRGEASEAEVVKVSPMKRDSVFAEEPDESPSQPPARKPRPMSSFLTELQLEQAQRESRLSTLASTTNTSISSLLAQESTTTTTKFPSQNPSASADPLTTNICIPSLPPNIDERSMGEFFSQWGDVATVKIMWPRGDQQRERPGGLTGFVAYMTRDHAERAFREVDGVTWGGVRVKCSWGKAMSLPKRALYPQRKKVEKEEEKIGSVGGGGVKKLVIRHRRNGKGREERRKEIRDRLGGECEETQRLFVETVASRIRANGVNFENVLREREADNPRFAFLFEPDSLLHQYFRICLDEYYVPSAVNEDLQQKPFDDDGSDELYSTDSGEESETRRFTSRSSSSSTTPLAPLAHHRLCSMLRSLTPRRERIARITSFALDHSSSYPSIVDILTSSLLQPSIPIPRKLARLYCISDLLHNSGTPISNAWRYRAAVEEKLPLVFAHLGMVARTFEGRMRREEFKRKVREVLDVWEGWIVVAPDVLERCRRVFECPPVASQLQGGRAADKAIVEEREDVDSKAFSENNSPAVKHDESTSIDEEEDLDGEAL
ncbi:nucleolin protein Nsr1 [Pseudozyma hubeiensis SY62]|uniref:Nucleolin protein Nsr1 n=1 Tax=Pseudozyma hubeiensis (strain SY62) TaxID=1305764 RepID=R9PCN8_PSEHS|nr:nucleolin protein Nsr1 [Pseudozyma hubeiensis SY62]GAC99168.1 nucleolin protein Nsr1 [Pseudozyma hubeiensis SY62]